MKRAAAALLAVSAAMAAAGFMGYARELWINGRRSASAPIERDGQVYVPVSALRDAGAEVSISSSRVSIQFVPVGGRVQLDAVEGLIGEWVSNSRWRVRVSGVERIANPYTGRGQGYKLVFEARSLATRSQSLHGSGLDQFQLVDSEGRVIVPTATSFRDRYSSVPPGGGLRNVLTLGDPRGGSAALGEADKVLILFRGSGPSKPKNMRIHLRPTD